MCTVTVERTPERYRVTMNRDELRTRGAEIPPERRAASGVSWIGPIDSDAGGTWFGTNEFGLTACLLNAYFPVGAGPEAMQQGVQSRGVIIPELLANRSFAQCESWIRGSLDPSQFAGFILLVVAPDECAHFLWPGHGELARVLHNDEWTFLTSSFVDSTDAEAWRHAAFQAWLKRGAPETDDLPHFHLQRDSGNESLSPLMERDYSVTRSITQAIVTADETRVRYWADPHPGLSAEQPSVSLSLRRAAGLGAETTS